MIKIVKARPVKTVPFKVKCVDDIGSHGHLKNGNVYVVHGESIYDTYLVSDVTPNSSKDWWFKSRFVDVDS